MNTHASNQVNAIRTTTKFCTDFPTPTSGITAFPGVLTTAINKLVLITNYDILVTGTTKGVTLDTKSIRSTMESIAFKCSSAVIAFASQTPVNNTLIALVKYSKTQLKESRKEDIGSICEKIRAAANDNIIGVSAYGISASDVTDLGSAISLYSPASSNPRQTQIDINNAKKQIKILIKQVNQDIFKNQMDRMVLTLETSNPEFVGKYFKAREIIDLGKSHTKIKGTTKLADGTPVPQTLIELMKTGTTQVLYTITSDNLGVIPNTYVLPGDYDFLAAHRGFQTIAETNIHFSPGETLKRNFVLIPV